MAEETKRPLKVFLCHASGDKPAVRVLYQRLLRDGVDAWLDREKLLPGQDWQLEIPKAVRESDVVVVCLSNKSITKEGYIQKEIKFALDIESEKPEGTIFLIPARLEECLVPGQLAFWQWVDLFEADGYERLLRSLRLRANKLGLRVGETIYTDREMEQRLEQLYTEGLAALWVEDWDKAYYRFQAILREKPDHMQALAKLDEAKRQKYFDTLYKQAVDAQQDENWPAVVEVLEKLTSEIPDYKDASLLLKNARKKHQFAQLYQEARRLHKAQQWSAVLKVFAQIGALEPNYQDPDNLFPSAEKELAELKRLEELNELYRRGVREIDAGRWYEARQLLEQIHKAQTGFLETERLLRKVENEIIKIEELHQRSLYINTLYEQAHELVRSKNWRKAVDKIEEVQRLDSQYEDRDGIFEKARTELDREEEIVQRQNELAAMYTEAVRLLKEGKYQEALDKWQEVSLMDPKYPDRQRVQSIARRKLTELAKPLRNKPRFIVTNQFWAGILGLMAFGVIVAGMVLWNWSNAQMIPVPTASSSSEPIAPSTTTVITTRTNTSPPSTSLAPIFVADPLMYDDFNNSEFDGNINLVLWDPNMPAGKISQEKSILTFELNDASSHIGLWAKESFNLTSPTFVESKLRLDPTSRENAGIYISFGSSAGDSSCGIWSHTTGTYTQEIACASELDTAQERSSVSITPGTWHVVRIELYPETMSFIYLVDGEKIGSYSPQDPDRLKDLTYIPLVFATSGTASTPSVTGYSDYVKIGEIEESETKETAYHWDFEEDWDGWDNYNHISRPRVADGYLTFQSTGPDPWIFSQPSLHVDASRAFIITIRMRVQGTRIGGRIFFVTDQDNSWDETKSIAFNLSNDDTFQTYHILMPQSSSWKGVVTQLRLDPIDQPDPLTSESQIAIDYISVHAP
jgi:outer membrane protein assembly factor BamD (BamD/ComL family)